MARKPNGNFTHGTSIGANGEILYDCPIEIKDKADLDNYGITWDDCKTLNFHGNERVAVYFYKTENIEFAKFQWSYLDPQRSCAQYPYGRKPEDRQAPVISLDGLIESGYDSAVGSTTEEQVHAKLEYSAIRTLMDKEDGRIAVAFEMKELYDYSVKDIAKKLKISEPRVYQLIARAKSIGREFRKNNA